MPDRACPGHRSGVRHDKEVAHYPEFRIDIRHQEFLTRYKHIVKENRMEHHHGPPAMSQRIFKLGLPVETVSAYLLCCGLVDSGQAITTKHLLDVWNSSKAALEKALLDLEVKRILRKIISDREENTIYKLNDDRSWKVI